MDCGGSSCGQCTSSSSFSCTRPTSFDAGYNIPTKDPSSDATWPVTAGSDDFASTCVDGYYGTVVATACTSDSGPYTLSGCSPCTAVTAAATDATYTCTSAFDTRVSACAADKVKDAGVDKTENIPATADICRAPVTCGFQVVVLGAAAAVPRTVACIAAGDSGCEHPEDCCSGRCSSATGFCDANPTGGNDAVCDPCNAGSFAVDSADDCVQCTAVTNAATDATYTCTSATDTRVSACADDKVKDAGVDKTESNSATADTCRAPFSTCGNQADSSSRTTTTNAGANTDIVCAACTAGTYAASGQNDCVQCTAINGAETTADAVTYICTSATDTRFATGGCNQEVATSKKKTVGANGAMTTCTGTCPVGTITDNNNMCINPSPSPPSQLNCAAGECDCFCPVGSSVKTRASATFQVGQMSESMTCQKALGNSFDGSTCLEKKTNADQQNKNEMSLAQEPCCRVTTTNAVAAKSGASVCKTPSLFVADNRFKYKGKQYKCSGIIEAVKITQQGQEVSINLLKNYAQFHWHNATCADFKANLKVDTISMRVLRDCCSDGKDTCFNTANSLSPSPGKGLSIAKATPSASDDEEEFVFDGLSRGERLELEAGTVAAVVVAAVVAVVIMQE